MVLCASSGRWSSERARARALDTAHDKALDKAAKVAGMSLPASNGAPTAVTQQELLERIATLEAKLNEKAR